MAITYTPSPSPKLGSVTLVAVNNIPIGETKSMRGAQFQYDNASTLLNNHPLWNNTSQNALISAINADMIYVLADIIDVNAPIKFDFECVRKPYSIETATINGQNVIGGLTYYETFGYTYQNSAFPYPIEREGFRFFLNPDIGYLTSVNCATKANVSDATVPLNSTIGQIGQPKPNLGGPTLAQSGYVASTLVYDPRLGDNQPEVSNWIVRKTLYSNQAPVTYGAFSNPSSQYRFVIEKVNLVSNLGAVNAFWVVNEILHGIVEIHQKAVSIVKNATTNTIVATGSITGVVNPGIFTILSVGSPNTISLDCSGSRGNSVASNWTITKNGLVAVDGVDYQLGVGQTLNDGLGFGTNVIDITFLTYGNYAVHHNCEGTYAGSIVSNNETSTLLIGVLEDDFEETFTHQFPTLTPVIGVQYGQSIVSYSPLTGIMPFRVNVELLMDKNNARITRSVEDTLAPLSPGINPAVSIVLDAQDTDEDWKIVFLEKCTITTNLVDVSTNSIIASLTGFDNLSFTINSNGNYAIQTIIRKKLNYLFTSLSWGGFPSPI